MIEFFHKRAMLGTLTRPDAGVQITFKGMPLYTYAGDSQPGQAGFEHDDHAFQGRRGSLAEWNAHIEGAKSK